MRILVEPSAHHLLNMGDVAMLTAAVERLQSVWPQAEVGVIANDPERLAVHCPRVTWVPAAGRQCWFDEPYIGARLHRLLPTRLADRVRSIEGSVRRHWPSIVAASIWARKRLKGKEVEELRVFLDWVSTAEMIVVVGAGLITDAFAPLALTVLELLETAALRGATTAMFGQGIGPVTDPRLIAVARRALPRVDLVCLREEQAGRAILRSLNVPEDRIVTTGDDTVELAYQARATESRGAAIGLSLRVARYSEVNDGMVSAVGKALRRSAERFHAELVSLPVSRYWKERDALVIVAALGLDASEADDPETPLELIERIRRCRVVVTGSYHAGVFALAQGIPAIGVAQSQYYVDKFAGLADQFAGHCPVVTLDAPALEERLMEVLAELWSRADDLRPKLLAAAERQIRARAAAFQTLRDIHTARTATSATR